MTGAGGGSQARLRSFFEFEKQDLRLWVYLLAALLYVFGVFEHIPYGGGHIYSDIATVFQTRFCPTGPCYLGVPYLHVFVEYPVITGFFIYAMGVLGQYIPFSASGNILSNYYFWTALFLTLPTFLSINELFKIGEILGVKSLNRRILLYFVATPSFVFMVLTNWYIIGVFFALFGLRKFLQGSRWVSGILLGISAGSNLITAIPALGMLFALKSRREVVQFVLGGVASFSVIYLPIYVFNPNFVSQFLNYEANWYIEGSWMLAFFNSDDSIRHYLFPVTFVLLSSAIIYKGLKIRKKILSLPNASSSQDWPSYTIFMAALFSFAWLFSSYISTPQTNLMLLPFFALLPMTKYYPEFLVFDAATSLIDVWGFSQPLLFLGITLHPVMFGSIGQSPIQALEVIRSIWIGKFLIYDGLTSGKFFGSRDQISQNRQSFAKSSLRTLKRFIDGSASFQKNVF
jgi:hypothetical protein